MAVNLALMKEALLPGLRRTLTIHAVEHYSIGLVDPRGAYLAALDDAYAAQTKPKHVWPQKEYIPY